MLQIALLANTTGPSITFNLLPLS